MKRFVIFGDIEFGKHDALVYSVKSAEFIEDADIEARAIELDNCDFIVPHYFDGIVTFVKYQEEK